MLQFKFRHISPHLQSLGKCKDEHCGTECAIYDESGKLISTGNAYLRPDTEVTVVTRTPTTITYDTRVIPGDQFSRPAGRKVAAARAIQSAAPRFGWQDKEGAEKRRLIWEQLFDQSPSTFRGSRV